MDIASCMDKKTLKKISKQIMKNKNFSLENIMSKLDMSSITPDMTSNINELFSKVLGLKTNNFFEPYAVYILEYLKTFLDSKKSFTEFFTELQENVLEKFKTDMSDGKFSKEEFDSAKDSISSSLNSFKENPMKIMDLINGVKQQTPQDKRTQRLNRIRNKMLEKKLKS